MPDSCQFEFEIRHLIEENPKELINKIKLYAKENLLANMHKVSSKTDIHFKEKVTYPGLSIDADSTDVKSVNKAVRDVIATFGRIDILVNNAQIEFAKPFPEVTEIEWQQLIDFNVKSMFLWSQSVGKLMIDQNKGRIVNMCSGLASRGLSNSVVYCVTQGAVRQMTSALAIEWAKSNVRVNAIGAGWMSTDLHAVESKKELLVRYIPSKRKGHPTDLCGLLVYLSSDACDFVTGQTIFIDGGAMAHA